MAKRYIFRLALLGFIIASALCALRFHDEEMMKQHHK